MEALRPMTNAIKESTAARHEHRSALESTQAAEMPADAARLEESTGATTEAPATASAGATTNASQPSRWVRRRGAERKPERPRSRVVKWLKRLAKVFAGFVTVVLVLWFLAHAFPAFGAWMADTARSIFGARAVAWLEDVAYGIKDDIERWRHGDDAPTTLWDAPSAPSAPPRAPEPTDPAGSAARPAFAPAPASVPFEKVGAAGDGEWVVVADGDRPSLAPALFKTMIHPDPRRPFGVLAVVAIDLSALSLELVAGTTEPESNAVALKDRPGVVRPEHVDRLVAAFNGGFKAVHGQYGMMLGGKTYLAPRGFACTVARYDDGGYRIGTWSDIEPDLPRLVYLRQGPPCLVEGGDVHKALLYNEYAKGWGATVSGDTVIRRSAIGIDEARGVLFYGIGEAMTAQSLAVGMKAAGASAVGELDVNYSYPRFLFYKRPAPDEAPQVLASLIPKVDYTADQYVTRPSPRDFFYLVRREPSGDAGPPPSNGAPVPPAAPPTTAAPAPSATAGD